MALSAGVGGAGSGLSARGAPRSCPALPCRIPMVRRRPLVRERVRLALDRLLGVPVRRGSTPMCASTARTLRRGRARGRPRRRSSAPVRPWPRKTRPTRRPRPASVRRGGGCPRSGSAGCTGWLVLGRVLAPPAPRLQRAPQADRLAHLVRARHPHVAGSAEQPLEQLEGLQAARTRAARRASELQLGELAPHQLRRRTPRWRWCRA